LVYFIYLESILIKRSCSFVHGFCHRIIVFSESKKFFRLCVIFVRFENTKKTLEAHHFLKFCERFRFDCSKMFIFGVLFVSRDFEKFTSLTYGYGTLHWRCRETFFTSEVSKCSSTLRREEGNVVEVCHNRIIDYFRVITNNCAMSAASIVSGIHPISRNYRDLRLLTEANESHTRSH
jgi:hypothetical protein